MVMDYTTFCFAVNVESQTNKWAEYKKLLGRRRHLFYPLENVCRLKVFDFHMCVCVSRAPILIALGGETLRLM